MKNQTEVIKANLLTSNNCREFLDGSSRTHEFLNSAVIGHGTYKPGWRWSHHAGAQTGKASEKHIGYIISGKFIIQDSKGSETLIGPGDTFEMGPNHDAWVKGNEPCVALDFYSLD